MTSRSALVSIGASGLAAIMSLVGSIALARALGPTVRGEVAAVTSWTIALGSLADIGLGFGAAYFVARDGRRANGIWRLSMVVAAVLGLVSWCAAVSLLGRTLNLPNVGRGSLVLGLAAVPLILAGTYVSHILLGLGGVHANAAIRLFAATTYAVGVVALYWAGQTTATWYVLAFTLAQMLSLAFGVTLGTQRFGLRWRGGGGDFGEVVRFGLRTHVGSVAAHLSLRLDQLLMSLLLQPRELGLYVVAVAVSSALSPIFSGLTVAATPAVLRAADAHAGARHGLGLALVGFGGGCALAVALAAIVPYLVRLVFGQQFVEASLPARVLLIAAVFQGTNQLLGTVLRAVGKPSLPGVAEVVGLLVTIVLLSILLPRFGGRGAAVTSLAAYAVVLVLQTGLLTVYSGATLSEGASEALLLLRRPRARSVQ